MPLPLTVAIVAFVGMVIVGVLGYVIDSSEDKVEHSSKNEERHERL